MYFPSTAAARLPPQARYAAIREVDLSACDGTALKAWHWPGERPVTLLVLHGNAGDRSDRLPWMERLRETGAGVFVLDYRGFGGSAGSPSEEGLYRDGEAAAEWIEANAPGRIVYVGESLGTGVAVELAVRRPPSGLVLQSAFTSAVDVARAAYPWLPVRLLLRDRYDSLSKIGRVACPILCIHGTRDGMIPIEMGRALYEQAKAPKEWLEVRGADHNDPIWDMAPEYVRRLSALIDRT